MKTLPKKWSEYLLSEPETGMDYHVVRVILPDGQTFEDVAIIHCSIIGEVRGLNEVPFEPENIVEMEVTHNKWRFRCRLPDFKFQPGVEGGLFVGGDVVDGDLDAVSAGGELADG